MVQVLSLKRRAWGLSLKCALVPVRLLGPGKPKAPGLSLKGGSGLLPGIERHPLARRCWQSRIQRTALT
jgi:hypothetical protein